MAEQFSREKSLLMARHAKEMKRRDKEVQELEEELQKLRSWKNQSVEDAAAAREAQVRRSSTFLTNGCIFLCVVPVTTLRSAPNGPLQSACLVFPRRAVSSLPSPHPKALPGRNP